MFAPTQQQRCCLRHHRVTGDQVIKIQESALCVVRIFVPYHCLFTSVFSSRIFSFWCIFMVNLCLSLADMFFLIVTANFMYNLLYLPSLFILFLLIYFSRSVVCSNNCYVRVSHYTSTLAYPHSMREFVGVHSSLSMPKLVLHHHYDAISLRIKFLNSWLCAS